MLCSNLNDKLKCWWWWWCVCMSGLTLKYRVQGARAIILLKFIIANVKINNI